MHYPPGIPSPYTATVHPYPTRYHGSINTRPVFGFPYVQSPHNVLVPSDFAGVGSWDVADGVFRRPQSQGGGIFANVLGGLGEIDGNTVVTVAVGALLGFVGVTAYLQKKGK